MSQKFRVRQPVKWNYAGNTAQGQNKEAFTEKVTRKVKAHEVTRDATDDEAVYLIEHGDGDQGT